MNFRTGLAAGTAAGASGALAVLSARRLGRRMLAGPLGKGRRARLELKHFRRHVMTNSLTHPDDVEGWRGEIHDSETVTTP